MSAIMECACGFRASGIGFEVQRAYRSHECEYHEMEIGERPDADPLDWPRVVVIVAFMVLLSFICSDGWGRFS